MSVDFVFDELTESDVNAYAEKAYVFNRYKKQIEIDKIILNSFSDERYGDSKEKLDVAVKNGSGRWNLLNISDKIESYNEIPLGYILSGVEYDKVLVIVRRMSSLIFDKSNVSSSSYIYSVIGDEYKNISNYPEVSGLLASNKIYLDKGFEELSKDIIDRFDNTKAEMIIGEIRKVIGE